MKEEKRDEERAGTGGKEDETGDPGRTPGTAEGDRKTVEEDLENEKGNG